MNGNAVQTTRTPDSTLDSVNVGTLTMMHDCDRSLEEILSKIERPRLEENKPSEMPAPARCLQSDAELMNKVVRSINDKLVRIHLALGYDKR